jgi:hypothetical protein
VIKMFFYKIKVFPGSKQFNDLQRAHNSTVSRYTSWREIVSKYEIPFML